MALRFQPSLATRAALLLVLLSCFAVASIPWTDTAAAQVTPIGDEPGTDAPGLGNITGSPEAGPKPEDAGDRGGWAQLGLAGVIAGAVLFIGSRIVSESRRSRAGAGNTTDPLSPDELHRPGL